MAQFLIKAGNTSKRLSYQAPNSSLFWDTQELNLYIYRNKWVLLGGVGKQRKLTVGDNLEIIFPIRGDTKRRQPVIRVVNNVDVNTVTLVIEETVNRVSFYKLGEWENQNFLPVFKYDKDHPAFLGGKIFTKTTRQGKTFLGEYIATVQSGVCNISGGDESRIKFEVAEGTIKGKKHFGFKTYDKETIGRRLVTVNGGENGILVPMYLISTKKNGVKFKTDLGTLDFELTNIHCTGSGVENNYSKWWRVKLGDFRNIANINNNTGSGLDRSPDSKYMYFDMWWNWEESTMSIDKLYIADEDVTTEEEIEAGVLVWDHHKVGATDAIDDSFEFIGDIWRSDTDNIPFTLNQEFLFASVYRAVAGHTATMWVTDNSVFVPPEKVEIWFDGWKDIPEEALPETDYTSEDIGYIKSISEDS